MIRNTFRGLITLLTVMSAIVTVSGQSLVINELMQSNIDGIMDDLNDFPDSWVELYNKGTTTVLLSDYRIGTTSNPSEAWALPTVAVPPGGHQVIFCDKEAKGLHTNFRIESGDGCEVFLYRGAILVDHMGILSKQPAPNIAFGRQIDGSDSWGYQLSPSPGSANTGRICDKDHILGHPVFSRAGSVETGARTIKLELSVPQGSPAGTTIHYTINGKEPTINSTTYTSPLNITSTTVIRAKLFCNGWLSPPSTTQSYIFFPRRLTLPVVSIVTDNDYLNSRSIGIFANNETDVRTYQKNWRRPINFEYFEDEGTESILNQLCETRVAGGNSRQFVKKTLVAYANKRFGTKRFSHEFFPDQKPGLTEFKSIALRNAGNDFDYLYMRDAVSQRSIASYVDLDWQAWRPAIVYINGVYYGMLNIRERANEDNVYTNHDKMEDIDLFENWDNLKEGDWTNLNKFTAFYKQSGHTMAEYEKWMDCKEFINLMILHLYYNNLDFPGNNIIMWRPREEGGRWRWIAKDVDYSLGLYGIPYNYKTLRWLYNPNYDKNYNWGANGATYTLLFRNLMEDKDFRNEFVERCSIYMGDFLNSKGVHKIWDPMYEMIRYEYPYHRNQINRYWPVYSDELKYAGEWLSRRTNEFYSQISSMYSQGAPIPVTINTNQAENPLKSLTFNGIPLSEKCFDGNYFANHPITIEGEIEEGKELIGWWIQQSTGTSSSSQEYIGKQVTIQMPSCSKLVIEPIYYSTRNGIKDITPENLPQPTAVYDLKGRLLRQGSSLDGLPRGIYIVGGKKVVH